MYIYQFSNTLINKNAQVIETLGSTILQLLGSFHSKILGGCPKINKEFDFTFKKKFEAILDFKKSYFFCPTKKLQKPSL